MQDYNSFLPGPKRTPWSKAPALARHVWSIRTRLQIEKRTRDLAGGDGDAPCTRKLAPGSASNVGIRTDANRWGCPTNILGMPNTTLCAVQLMISVQLLTCNF
jgi:hypothetical protein